MFKSSKSLVVAAGLVGAVLVSNVHARGFGSGGGGSHISASNSSAARGNTNFKPSTNSHTPAQVNAVKPANTPSKFGNVSKTNKLVKSDKGNQFSTGKHNFLPGKSQTFEKQMDLKCCKSLWGCYPWGSCWDWGCCGWDFGYCGGYYGCGYNVCCCDYYSPPSYIACCDASPAIAAVPAIESAPAMVRNPATNEAAPSSAAVGQTQTLQAGESTDVDTTSGNEMQSDLGKRDTARCSLSEGTDLFAAASTDWELFLDMTSDASMPEASTPDADDGATNE